MPFLDDLRKAVERDKRTRREIADAAKISPVSLSRLMNEPRDLPMSVAERLADVLGGRVALAMGRPKKRKGT